MTAATIWIGARLSALPARIVANSTVSAELHQQRLGFCRHRWTVIPNGFEVKKFTPSENAREQVRAELGLAQDTLLIGLIGRYHPMKDHANFLSAAGILRKDAPGVHFLLAGTGVDGSQCRPARAAGGIGSAGMHTPARRKKRYVPNCGRSRYRQLFFVFRSVSERDWRGHVLRCPVRRNRRRRFRMAGGRYGPGSAGPRFGRPVAGLDGTMLPRRFPSPRFGRVGSREDCGALSMASVANAVRTNV